jgi:hypothetical protein
VALLAVGHASAQDRRYNCAEVRLPSGCALALGAHGSDGPAATIRWTPYFAKTVVFALPFTDVGDAIGLLPDRLLVSGRTVSGTTSTGHICVLALDEERETIRVEQDVTWPGLDPYAISWHVGRAELAVYDRAHDELLAGSWAADRALPAVHQLQRIAIAADVPELAEDFVQLTATNGGFGVRTCRMSPWLVIEPVKSGWFAAVEPFERTPRWSAALPSIQGASGRLQVMARGGIFAGPPAFELVFVDGGDAVVAAGEQTAEDAFAAIPAPPQFHDFPGGAFRVRSAAGAGVADSFTFRPLVRYGTPSPGVRGLRLACGKVDSERVCVGSASFEVWAPLMIASQGASRERPFGYHAYLALALGQRGAGAPPDPVAMAGDHGFLQAEIALEFRDRGQLPDKGDVHTTLAVPDDAALEGTIVLMQWYVQSAAERTDVVCSDVFATRVWPRRAPAAAGAEPANGTAAAPPATARAAWLAQLAARNEAGHAQRFRAMQVLVR